MKTFNRTTGVRLGSVVAVMGLALLSTQLWEHHGGSTHLDSESLGLNDLSTPYASVDAVSYSVNTTPTLLQSAVNAAKLSNDAPSKSAIEMLSDASRSVAEYVSRSFRISLKKAQAITDIAVRTGEEKNVDPLLILAVIATESSYNPKARSSAGAEGLMQVMTSVHRHRYVPYGGEDKAFDPNVNIAVGTDILNELIQRTGNVRKALKWYSGAANKTSDGGYAARVLAERYRLAIAAAGNIQSAVELSLTQRTEPNFKLDDVPSTLAYDEFVTLALADNA